MATHYNTTCRLHQFEGKDILLPVLRKRVCRKAPWSATEGCLDFTFWDRACVHTWTSLCVLSEQLSLLFNFSSADRELMPWFYCLTNMLQINIPCTVTTHRKIPHCQQVDKPQSVKPDWGFRSVQWPSYGTFWTLIVCYFVGYSPHRCLWWLWRANVFSLLFAYS